MNFQTTARQAILRSPIVNEPSRARGADAPSTVEPEVEFLARWLDDIFVIPGTNLRIGLDGLLGLVPGLGDTLTSLAAFYILAAGRRYGVPRITLVRMAGNIAVDYVLGTVPVIGDLFDICWKANRRNVRILERHLQATPAEQHRARRGDWLIVGGLILALIALLVGCVTIAWWCIATLGHLLLQARS